MRAVWYERFGSAEDVLTLGEMEAVPPGPGEVQVRLKATGINPSDVKLRGGARPGAAMAYPRVVPHSDGAGVVEAAGAGAKGWVGKRVWICNAGWQRAFGTAAECVTVPQELVAELPEGTSFVEGACLGIPALTAWYALKGVTPGQKVLVTGGAGAVGRYACQMAQLMGAEVVTTVSSPEKGAHAGVPWINYRTEDVAARVTEMLGAVDRTVDVDFAANQQAALQVIKPGGVISGYASASVMSPELDWYGFMFKNVTLRMLIVYQLTPAERAEGQAQINDWLAAGKLTHAVVPGGGLEDMAAAHTRVERGDKLGTVVVSV
ncbi:NADPH:quinone reductase [Pseudaestuariivita sp.]|uniref:NADPH:quinone reductase n=1 Tax=Pseudaestuariivita sp. TaxID=2211669 RepID=UPI004059F79A